MVLPGRKIKKGRITNTTHGTAIYAYTTMPISWGGLSGQCRHIWQSHGASGNCKKRPVDLPPPPNSPVAFKSSYDFSNVVGKRVPQRAALFDYSRSGHLGVHVHLAGLKKERKADSNRRTSQQPLGVHNPRRIHQAIRTI